jgi:hypothetical protein
MPPTTDSMTPNLLSLATSEEGRLAAGCGVWPRPEAAQGRP